MLGDLELSSGLEMSPLYRNRTEALTRGFDLRKVYMWGLIERVSGRKEGEAQTMQLCTMPLSFPGGAGQYTLPSLTAQKTQQLCVSLRSLGSQHLPSQ